MTFDLGEELARMLADGMRAAGQLADSDTAPGQPPHPEMLLDKKACYIQVPNELLMDAGVIPDTRTHKRPTRRERVRYGITAARDRFAYWAFRRIAGYDVPESDY